MASSQADGHNALPLSPQLTRSRNPFRDPEILPSVQAQGQPSASTDSSVQIPRIQDPQTDNELASALQAATISEPNSARDDRVTSSSDRISSLVHSNQAGPSRVTSSALTANSPKPWEIEYAEPTAEAMPGRPLLRDGRLLLMPPTWEGCAECGGTGYQGSDPSHPHDSCWKAYGRSYYKGLASSSEVLDGALILQKTLPDALPRAAGTSTAGPLTTGSYHPPSQPPPGMAAPSDQRTFSPPPGPPPPTSAQQQFPPPPNHPSRLQPTPSSGNVTRRRRSPPRVNRAEDADEASTDADGEAPPAYEDVIRVPQGTPLPPQRRMSNGLLSGRVNGDGPIQTTGQVSNPNYQGIVDSHNLGAGYGPRPNAVQQSGHLPPGGWPSPGRMDTSGGGGYPGAAYHGPQHGGPPAPFGAYGSFVGHGPVPRPFPYPHHAGHFPATGPQGQPLVVQPGDSRIGGRLCYKCGGSGLRESLWWGDETCHVCGGIGRIL